jgi:hypothetical protein
MSQIPLYQTENGREMLDVRLEGQTVDGTWVAVRKRREDERSTP